MITARNSFKLVYIIIIIINISINVRPPYPSVRIASFRKFNKFSAHVKMAANYEMKKQQKIMIPFGSKNINVISKNEQIKMVASDMYAVKKVAQHQ